MEEMAEWQWKRWDAMVRVAAGELTMRETALVDEDLAAAQGYLDRRETRRARCNELLQVARRPARSGTATASLGRGPRIARGATGKRLRVAEGRVVESVRTRWD